MAALDLAEPQVLIHTPNGSSAEYTHLILLRKIRPAESRWVCLFPDGTLDVRDLSVCRITVLLRRARFPEWALGRVDEFARPPDETGLALLHAQATATANLLGGDAAAAPVATAGISWRVSHTGSEHFGVAIEDSTMASPDTGIARGAMGLALHEGVWVHVERVPDAELAAWRSYVLSGPGRDPRIAGDVRDAGNRRYCNLNDYVSMLREVDHTKDPSWPHRGPSAGLEVLQGVRATNKELVAYDEHWARQSGISQDSAVRHEHRTIFHALALFQSIDQIDLPATAGGEMLFRRAIQIQRATKACPSAPNFLGLHMLTAHSMDERGGLAVQNFTQHFSQAAEVEARIMRQNRLLRAEMSGTAPAYDDDGSDGDVTAAALRRQRRVAAKAKAKAKAKAAAAP